MHVLRRLLAPSSGAKIESRAPGLGSTLGYGVIGNTEVSGTFVLGSSPGTPALKTVEKSAVFYLSGE